jgi:hypothetical protein
MHGTHIVRFVFMFSIIISLCSISVHAQTIKICNDSVKKEVGEVRVMQSPLITDEIKPTVLPEDGPTMPGYRIQVYAGTDRAAATKLKNDIAASYNVPTYILYEQPYFKVRVGDYRNKIEAQQMFHALKQQNSGILLVPGDINWPELKQ